MYHTTFLSGPDPAFLQHKHNVKCGSGTHNLGPETHSFIPVSPRMHNSYSLDGSLDYDKKLCKIKKFDLWS